MVLEVWLVVLSEVWLVSFPTSMTVINISFKVSI